MAKFPRGTRVRVQNIIAGDYAATVVRDRGEFIDVRPDGRPERPVARRRITIVRTAAVA